MLVMYVSRERSPKKHTPKGKERIQAFDARLGTHGRAWKHGLGTVVLCSTVKPCQSADRRQEKWEGEGLKWHGRARQHGGTVPNPCPAVLKNPLLHGWRSFCVCFFARSFVGFQGLDLANKRCRGEVVMRMRYEASR